MTVVTLSAQIGCRTRDVGRAVAERLQLHYIDQDILVAAARALGVPAKSVASLDQRAAGFADRLAAVLPGLQAGVGARAGTTLDIVLGRTYAEAAAGSESALDAVASAVQAEQPDLRAHAAPDGTITILFTDIEGSTALNERLGDPAWPCSAAITKSSTGKRGPTVASRSSRKVTAS